MSELKLEIKYPDPKFHKKTCKKCNAVFWTVDPDRDTCGEYPCDDYSFIDHPVTDRKYEFFEMLDKFYEFFSAHGHTVINRYPVVARWRKDVLLVNASIYDFQPFVTSGLIPPPANPLIVGQPCIRMVDVDDVGKTGRHLTSFIMVGHHAFNYPDHKVYWTDQTVKYSYEFLVDILKIDPKKITYKENPWSGGGNGGFALEVIVAGLEVATLVFMNLKEDEHGEFEIEGKKYSKMDMNIVDTGYGLERFVWASKGSPSIFDAVYEDILEKLLALVNIKIDETYNEIVKQYVHFGKNERLEEAVYQDLKAKGFKIDKKTVSEMLFKIKKTHILVDHSRTVLFMLNDGIVPSNVKAGYLARLLIRKSFRALEDLGISTSFSEIVLWQFEKFKNMLDPAMKNTIIEILDNEKQKYTELINRGKSLIEREIKKKKIGLEDLVELYDSYGLTPEFVASYASSLGTVIEVPDNFHSLVASRHEKNIELEQEKQRVFNLPDTVPLYYNDAYIRKFNAKVIYCQNNELVLDQTAFYPEGGGQPADGGYIIFNNENIKVLDVQKYGKVIVHKIEKNVPVNSEVTGIIDSERRDQLMRSHSATHVLLSAARTVLGKHVWQAGAQKGVTESRLDITHFKKISFEELRAIEREALNIILQDIKLEIKYMDREKAEKEFGFKLYEGGIPTDKTIRVVKIGDYDVEGCGGMHVKSTGEIGLIKIIREERIQDGISRITFTAGKSALNYIADMERILKSASEQLKTDYKDMNLKLDSILEEWKAQKKEIARLSEIENQFVIRSILESSKTVKNQKIAASILKDRSLNLVSIARDLNKEPTLTYFIVNSADSKLSFVAGSKNIDVENIIKSFAKDVSGTFKKVENFYIGSGKDNSNIDKLVDIVQLHLVKAVDLNERNG